MGQTVPTNYCTGLDPDEIHEIGEQWTDKGSCHLKTCMEDGETWIDECDVMPKEVPERCRIIPEDLTRKFPDCCPRLECPSKYQLSDEVRDDYQDLVTNLEFAMKRMVENEKIIKEEDEAEEKELLKKIIIQVIVASWLASEPHNRKSMRA